MNYNMNSYDLSRSWFDWCFENPEKISPNHTAIFFFAIEHCNRLGWKEKFGFPTQMVMDAIGIKKFQTYIRYFNDLVDWNFIILVQKSVNQYSSNIISLNNACTKNGKALDKAIIKHGAKQTEKQIEGIGQSIGQSNSTINKHITINQEQINYIEKIQKNFDLSFIDEKYKKIFFQWCEYKNYENQTQIEFAYKDFISLSLDSVKHAEIVVAKSIAGGYKGLFKVEPDPNIFKNVLVKNQVNQEFKLDRNYYESCKNNYQFIKWLE